MVVFNQSLEIVVDHTVVLDSVAQHIRVAGEKATSRVLCSCIPCTPNMGKIIWEIERNLKELVGVWCRYQKPPGAAHPQTQGPPTKLQR